MLLNQLKFFRGEERADESNLWLLAPEYPFSEPFVDGGSYWGVTKCEGTPIGAKMTVVRTPDEMIDDGGHENIVMITPIDRRGLNRDVLLVIRRSGVNRLFFGLNENDIPHDEEGSHIFLTSDGSLRHKQGYYKLAIPHGIAISDDGRIYIPPEMVPDQDIIVFEGSQHERYFEEKLQMLINRIEQGRLTLDGLDNALFISRGHLNFGYDLARHKYLFEGGIRPIIYEKLLLAQLKNRVSPYPYGYCYYLDHQLGLVRNHGFEYLAKFLKWKGYQNIPMYPRSKPETILQYHHLLKFFRSSSNTEGPFQNVSGAKIPANIHYLYDPRHRLRFLYDGIAEFRGHVSIYQ